MIWLKLLRSSVQACLLAGLLRSPLALAEQGQPEYKLKAALLINFTKFVIWPTQTLPPGISLTICIVGTDPFGPVLDNDKVTHEIIDRHPLTIKRIVAFTDLNGCHVAFISPAETVAEILPLLHETPILTVSDTDEFIQQGGMINFINGNKNIGFEVNLSAARKTGINISSKLLALAKTVLQD